MSNLISADALKNLLGNNNLKIFDASNHPKAYQNYLESHIVGTHFIDTNKDLANIKSDAALGGRHPLPDIADFQKSLQQLGIKNSDHIIIYDDKAGANAAARFWWMLKSIGHERVQVLDGGLKAAYDEAVPMDSVIPEKIPSDYTISNWHWPLVTMDKVIDVSKTNTQIIVDVRENYRYAGESEPIDLIAGHIPNAINMPYIDNLDDAGKFKDVTTLNQLYQELFKGKAADEIIFHCGSGITACHSILACEEAGLGVPSLYVGSWSEWSRNNQDMILKK